MKIRWLKMLAFTAAGLAGCGPLRTDVAVAGGGPRALAVGDVNGDGKAEIVVGHLAALDPAGDLVGASVLVAQGVDVFKSQPVALTEFEPDTLLLADLNGDGRLDLVASRHSPGGGGSVRVLLGRGDGTFFAAGELQEVGTPLAIAAGDVDGDGKVDLVVAAAAPGAPLQVHRGLGDGTFQRPELHYDVAASEHLAVSDVSGDGRPDVVMGTFDGHVDVLLNDGSGGLLAPIRARVGDGNVAIAIGDVRGTGRPAIVAAAAKSPSMSVITGIGALFFAQSYPLERPATNIAVGDVDGDGKLDVVTLDTEASTVSVMQQTHDGGYQTSLTVSVGRRPVALALADLHGTGKLDAVTANEKDGSITVLHFAKK